MKSPDPVFFDVRQVGAIGPVLAAVRAGNESEPPELIRVRFGADAESSLRDGHTQDRSRLDPVFEQLEQYAAGTLRDFSINLSYEGTPFQRQVWSALQDIPYGQTISYGELARRIGQPSASRAVGAANGQNPLAIVIPCHRVIGSNGSLTGFGGGLQIKSVLLDLERQHAGLFATALEPTICTAARRGPGNDPTGNVRRR